MGMLGAPSLAVVLANLIFVDGSINGSEGNAVLIDSGSPVVLIDGDPGVFRGLTLPTTQQVTVNFSFLDDSGMPVVTIDNIPAIQLTTAMMDSNQGFAGILGGNVLRQFSVQLDYAAPMMSGFCLGCTSAPRGDVESPGAAIPFKLAGGGLAPVEIGSSTQSGLVNIPPTRIPLTVDVEGTTYHFMLDTGASEVTLSAAAYQTLVADGRPELAGGIPISTVNGNMTASVTRAKTITIGGETVTDAPVMTIPVADPADDLLANLGQELGVQLDGLLGGSFLRNFLVTIAYPSGQLHLQRYNSPPVADEFRRVGITVNEDSGGTGFLVTSVYPGSDAAAKQVSVNDQVLAIGSVQLDPIADQFDADNLLDGTPGTTIQIKFGRAMSPTIANQTVGLLVDDLIPNPQ
jgi:hypothetical protein